MEVRKLLNILIDIENDESFNNLEKSLNELKTFIHQNNELKIEEVFKTITSDTNNSTLNSYSLTDKKILKEIGGYKYFGIQLQTEIELILKENTFKPAVLSKKLNTFNEQRSLFISTTENIRKNLEILKIEPHYLDKNFELGLILPSKEKYKTIKTISRELNKWDKAIKSYSELTGQDIQDTKITLLNNGSLEFFTESENLQTVALCISVTLERLAKLYKNILDIKTSTLKLKEAGIPKGQIEQINNHQKDIYHSELDKISSDIIKDFAVKSIDPNRLNELKISIKGHTEYIAKCVDNGLIIEINPPEVSSPPEVEESDTDAIKKEKLDNKSKFDKLSDNINLIKKGTEATKDIFNIGKDVYNLISTVNEEDNED